MGREATKRNYVLLVTSFSAARPTKTGEGFMRQAIPTTRCPQLLLVRLRFRVFSARPRHGFHCTLAPVVPLLPASEP